VIAFSKIFSSRLNVGEQGDAMADSFKVIDRKRNTDVGGNRKEVRNAVCRSADGGVDDDRVLMPLA